LEPVVSHDHRNHAERDGFELPLAFKSDEILGASRDCLDVSNISGRGEVPLDGLLPGVDAAINRVAVERPVDRFGFDVSLHVVAKRDVNWEDQPVADVVVEV
jgi:hypothetical protein